MVAEGIDDADGHILTSVRKVIGSRVPIVVQPDIHSNVSRQMVAMADVSGSGYGQARPTLR